MIGCLKMLGGMLVLRIVTAAHMAADQAQAQVDPGIADRQAFLAPLRRPGHDRLNQTAVGAGLLRISIRAGTGHGQASIQVGGVHREAGRSRREDIPAHLVLPCLPTTQYAALCR